MKRSRLPAACVIVALAITGCSLFGQKAPDYQASGELPPLEVPPDLTKPVGDGQTIIPAATAVSQSAESAAQPQQPAQPPAAAGPIASLRDMAGIPVLLVGDSLSRTWASTAEALIDAGLMVRERNEQKRIYYVEDAREDERSYQIHLLDRGEQTMVTAHNDSNQAIDPEVARKLLTRVQQAL